MKLLSEKSRLQTLEEEASRFKLRKEEEEKARELAKQQKQQEIEERIRQRRLNRSLFEKQTNL